MDIIQGTTEFHISQPTAICIGKFDGVHSGHKKLLERVVKQRDNGLLPVAFTFDLPPEELFSGVHNDELCTHSEKYASLEKLGIELVIEYPVNMDTASVSPEDFIENILIEKLNMKYIAAGPDISFGKGGAGDRRLMEEYGKKYGYKVDIIKKLTFDGSDISSSRIRQAIKDGDVRLAERMLGRE